MPKARPKVLGGQECEERIEVHFQGRKVDYLRMTVAASHLIPREPLEEGDEIEVRLTGRVKKVDHREHYEQLWRHHLVIPESGEILRHVRKT